MKAKIFVSESQVEIRLNQDDKVFLSKKNESKAAFIKRVTKAVEKEYLEELTLAAEIDIKKIKKRVTAQLEHRLTLIPTGVESKMIKEVLDSRGVKASTPTAAKNATVKDAEQVKPTNKRKIDPDRQAAIEAMKASKPYKAAAKNIGEKISFKPFKSNKTVKGVIKNLSLNKKLTKIYYSIQVGKTRSSCAVENESVKIG